MILGNLPDSKKIMWVKGARQEDGSKVSSQSKIIDA